MDPSGPSPHRGRPPFPPLPLPTPQPPPPPQKEGSPPLRAVLLGPPGVGKSSLARAFAWPDPPGTPPGTPPPHPEGREPPRERRLRVDGVWEPLELLDGAEEAVGGADALLLVFSLSDRGSFSLLSSSPPPPPKKKGGEGKGEGKGEGPPPPPLILVANKSDLARARQVTPRETRGLAALLGCSHLETSASLRHGTHQLFEAAVRQARLHRRRLRDPPGPGKEEEEEEEEEDGGDPHRPPQRRRRSLTGRAKRFFAGLVPLARQRSKSCSDLAAL